MSRLLVLTAGVFAAAVAAVVSWALGYDRGWRDREAYRWTTLRAVPIEVRGPRATDAELDSWRAMWARLEEELG